jgi:hypothetical protein
MGCLAANRNIDCTVKAIIGEPHASERQINGSSIDHGIRQDENTFFR